MRKTHKIIEGHNVSVCGLKSTYSSPRGFVFASTEWHDVTCQKCLKHAPKDSDGEMMKTRAQIGEGIRRLQDAYSREKDLVEKARIQAQIDALFWARYPEFAFHWLLTSRG